MSLHQSHTAQVEVRVDGALNPELIPDDVAYYHFFRVLARNPSMNQELDKRRRIAYVKYYFRRDCGPQNTEDRSLSEIQTERLLAAAELIMGRTPQLRNAPASPATPPDELAANGAARMRQVYQIVAEGVKQLPWLVDADSAAKIHSHVLERVKRRVRLLNVRVPYAP
jgi:hypothetical protein